LLVAVPNNIHHKYVVSLSKILHNDSAKLKQLTHPRVQGSFTWQTNNSQIQSSPKVKSAVKVNYSCLLKKQQREMFSTEVQIFKKLRVHYNFADF